MADINIAEYEGEHLIGGGGRRPPVAGTPLASDTLTYTAAAQSAVFGDNTHIIRVCPDADAFIAFGANPTADGDSVRVPANAVEYFGVVPGERISVYDGSS